MNTEREKKTQSPLTGKRFSSVADFLKQEGTTEEVASRMSELSKETRLVQMLVDGRRDAGLTQQQMADKLGLTQGAISKLESSNDTELTVEEIKKYSAVLQQRYVLMIGKPMNHAAAIKWHALEAEKAMKLGVPH